MFRRKPRPEWEQRLRDIDKELERPINEDWHLGKKDDAARCRKKRDADSTGGTWQDIQAEFQKDAGNPY